MRHSTCTLQIRSLSLILLLGASAAHADEVASISEQGRPKIAIGYQVEVSVASTYVFRGIPQYNKLYDASSQNTALLRLDNVGQGSVTFAVWNATALRGYGGQPGSALELDVIGSYGGRVRGAFDLSVGYIGYLFPAHASAAPLDGAHELTGSFSYANPYLVPSVAIYGEFVRLQGAYLAIGLARDVIYKLFTFTPSLNLGLAAYRHYQGTDAVAKPHVNDLTLALTGKLTFPRDFYATLRVAYSLRGTPESLMTPSTDNFGFQGRSSLYGALAIGFAR